LGEYKKKIEEIIIMGDVEIVVKVRVPEEIDKTLGDVIARDVRTNILKEYNERAKKAKKLLKILEKSKLSEKDAKELEEMFKEDLAKYHGVI